MISCHRSGWSSSSASTQTLACCPCATPTSKNTSTGARDRKAWIPSTGCSPSSPSQMIALVGSITRAKHGHCRSCRPKLTGSWQRDWSVSIRRPNGVCKKGRLGRKLNVSAELKWSNYENSRSEPSGLRLPFTRGDRAHLSCRCQSPGCPASTVILAPLSLTMRATAPASSAFSPVSRASLCRGQLVLVINTGRKDIPSDRATQIPGGHNP
ncbi:hypothetical protein D3C85_1184890 [compost metagenome]